MIIMKILNPNHVRFQCPNFWFSMDRTLLFRVLSLPPPPPPSFAHTLPLHLVVRVLEKAVEILPSESPSSRLLPLPRHNLHLPFKARLLTNVQSRLLILSSPSSYVTFSTFSNCWLLKDLFLLSEPCFPLSGSSSLLHCYI